MWSLHLMLLLLAISTFSKTDAAAADNLLFCVYCTLERVRVYLLCDA